MRRQHLAVMSILPALGLRTVKLSPEEAEEAETMKRRRRQYS